MSNSIFKKIAGPQLFAFCLLWLMVLTVIGTVSQKWIGLYQAQKIFFSSSFFFISDILVAFRGTGALPEESTLLDAVSWLPLPGTLSVLILVGIGLSLKTLKDLSKLKVKFKPLPFLFFIAFFAIEIVLLTRGIFGHPNQTLPGLDYGQSVGLAFLLALVGVESFSRVFKQNKKIGTLIVHIGSILLLLGGLITFLYSKEGFMQIPENGKSSIIEDFEKRELVISDISHQDYDIETTFAKDWLQEGEQLQKSDAFPFQIQILNVYRNAGFFRLSGSSQPQYKGELAKRFELRSIPRDVDETKNSFGLIVRIQGADEGSNGDYIVLENILIKDRIRAGGKEYEIELRREQTHLDYAIELLDFVEEKYPGVQMAKAYRSQVILHKDGSSREHTIKMNHPLREGKYTFYQSSFIPGQNGQEQTILQCVFNLGYYFPYLSSLIMCFGLMVHLRMNIPQLIPYHTQASVPIGLAVSAGLFACLLFGAFYFGFNQKTKENSLDFDTFSRITIQNEGRLKPLQSFAQNRLMSFSHSKSADGLQANAWLAKLLFNPLEAMKDRIFKIRLPEVLDTLKLDRTREKNLYSFIEVTNGLMSNQDYLLDLSQKRNRDIELDVTEQKMEQLNDLANFYYQLAGSFSFLRPEIQIPTGGPLKEQLFPNSTGAISYFDLAPKIKDLMALLPDNIGQSDFSKFTPIQQETMLVFQQVMRIQKGVADPLFNIFPTDNNLGWLSPIDLMQKQERFTDHPALTALNAMVKAYMKQDSQGFEQSCREFLVHQENTIQAWEAHVQEHHQSNALTTPKHSLYKRDLEVEYSRKYYFTKTIVLYSIGFFFLLLYFISSKLPLKELSPQSLNLQNLFLKSLIFICYSFVFAGLLLHGSAILDRILILGRAPISTLYDTMICAGFFAAFMGCLYELIKRNGLGLFIATYIGVSMLFLSMQYEKDGDTFKMLVPVLNSQFWLTIHVTTIIIGYASTMVASLIGHAFLLYKVFNLKQKKALNDFSQLMLGASLVALFFTLFGTILGGIWGDQSWGRFWGWDPKENGALLIVFGLLFLIHARMTKWFSSTLYAAGLVICNILVALAWFGVNLLAVGLHSYGFDNGTAANLQLFCIVETAFAIVMVLWIVLREDQQKLQSAEVPAT